MFIIGHQVGLTGTVRDCNAQDTYNNVILHAGFGKACNLPLVIATGVEQGDFSFLSPFWRNGLLFTHFLPTLGLSGPLLAEIADTYPDATIVRRGSEINAWGNADFRAAVKATGKEQVIVDGIAADVSLLACLQSVVLDAQTFTGLYRARLSLPPWRWLHCLCQHRCFRHPGR